VYTEFFLDLAYAHTRRHIAFNLVASTRKFSVRASKFIVRPAPPLIPGRGY
jgi:hypothetical protein